MYLSPKKGFRIPDQRQSMPWLSNPQVISVSRLNLPDFLYAIVVFLYVAANGGYFQNQLLQIHNHHRPIQQDIQSHEVRHAPCVQQTL